MQLAGSQMELVALRASGWSLSPLGVASPPRALRAAGERTLTPVFHYPFESANRRMTVVCQVEGSRAMR